MLNKCTSTLNCTCTDGYFLPFPSFFFIADRAGLELLIILDYPAFTSQVLGLLACDATPHSIKKKIPFGSDDQTQDRCC